jgi:competence protein ComEC
MVPPRKKIDMWSGMIIFSLMVLDVVLWQSMLRGIGSTPRIYFLGTTQGNSELVIFSQDIKVLTDAGSDGKIVGELQKELPSGDLYIDVAMISYAQADNFNGYFYILDHYQVGAFIYNGRSGVVDLKEWQQLVSKIHTKNIPLIALGAGDSIQVGNGKINILSPTSDSAVSPELSETALVARLVTPSIAVLLASDIDKNVEDGLLADGVDLRADVLKVPYPGSGVPPSSDMFLHAVGARINIVAPGAKNTASAPSRQMLAALASSTTAAVLQTDQKGTVEILPNHGKLMVLTQK